MPEQPEFPAGTVQLHGLESAFVTKDERGSVYDHDQIIDILMERDGMDVMDAQEFFDYNIERLRTYTGLNLYFSNYDEGDEDE